VDGKAEPAIAEARSKMGAELRVILVWQGRHNSTNLAKTGEEHGGASLSSGGAENHTRSHSSAVT